ncbi:DoxX family protein [uncultured Secundilactobacillus sp.]|uniref:DoxX family protein n=1 Tax=uncultured Secundilactobacillus sp. TaxID=2813935 RepID=UPI002584A682|nr:DoxX family protein [uncultured Secundilactobacillus sp.]
MVKWLRQSTSGMVVTTLLRLYVGFLWIGDGWSKVSKGFDATGFITNAIKNPVMTPEGQAAYGWYTSFLKGFVQPHMSLFNVLVSWGELLVGLGLFFGTLATAAAFFGMVMNFAYLFAGTVSVNPLFIIIEIFILVSGFNASKIGLDRWIIPWLRDHVSFLKRSVE